MTTATHTLASPQLTALGGGVFSAPGARIIDRSGRKRMPIGWADFVEAVRRGVVVDKTMLIADVLDNAYAATLFCRPRRFGKTLNMTMLKAFLEAPEAGGLSREEALAVFEHTEIWDAEGGAYREHQGAYPVVHLSLASAKKDTWGQAYGELRGLIMTEYLHHAYLRKGETPLASEEIAYFDRITTGTASDADYASSLAALCRMLHAYHGMGAVVLIDEYDAPVMSGYDKGYYDEVVNFLKGWLSGELKDGGPTLALACLTGVQRISKESIFSDLNNLYVSTSLNTRFDERYGFTDSEVAALLAYTGHSDSMPEAREWYDGYRFGNADVYNPWSIISYVNEGCSADVYWGNTSGNGAVHAAVNETNMKTLDDVFTLLEAGGTISARLDLGIVFSDLKVQRDALWSLLYLAGYLTTDDVNSPGDKTLRRRLRVPDREVATVFRAEVIERFTGVAGDIDRVDALHDALVAGDAAAFEEELQGIALQASSFDLTNEQACHMLLLGLLFGVPGYADPTSNREMGYGRFDIQLRPAAGRSDGVTASGPRPLVTIELKFLRPDDAPEDPATRDAALRELAEAGVAQIVETGYDAELPAGAQGRLRWGIAFSGKHVAAVCERGDAV